MSNQDPIHNARELRSRQTKAEGLLWAVLHAKQLCGLKFRRQHPEAPYVLDFACCAHRLAVEVDGGYHDQRYELDTKREQYLIDRGWDVVRFSNEDVLCDVESVAVAIARHIGVQYAFTKRQDGISSVSDRAHLNQNDVRR